MKVPPSFSCSFGADRARDHVGRAAGRERHEQGHRLGRPGLRVGAGGGGQPEGEGGQSFLMVVSCGMCALRAELE